MKSRTIVLVAVAVAVVATFGSVAQAGPFDGIGDGIGNLNKQVEEAQKEMQKQADAAAAKAKAEADAAKAQADALAKAQADAAQAKADAAKAKADAAKAKADAEAAAAAAAANAGNGAPPTFPTNPGPFNPGPFTESPRKISSVDIDPITGEVRVNTIKAKVKDSYTDADRNIVVGNVIPVNQPVFDSNGNLIGRKVGTAWQSLSGKWHYDVKIVAVNNTGGTDTTHILGFTKGK